MIHRQRLRLFVHEGPISQFVLDFTLKKLMGFLTGFESARNFPRVIYENLTILSHAHASACSRNHRGEPF